jgi:hypothetical protein
MAKSGSWGRTLTALLAAVALLLAGEARAFIILGGGGGATWVVRCNAHGATFAISAVDIDAAITIAESLCVGHGGVANVTDAGVLSALNDPQICDTPSTTTIGRDLGSGSYETLTLQDLDARLAASNGSPVHLVGHEVLSLNIGGIDLLPNPPPNLPAISVRAIYSDQHDDGGVVGGSTSPGFCPVEVPNRPELAILLATLMALLGGAALAGARRRDPRANAARVGSDPGML